MSSGGQSGVVQGHLHAGDRPAAFGVDIGNAIGIGRGAVAEDLAEDRRTAPPGMFQFFQHDHGGAFAQDESIAQAIEGTRGLLQVDRCVSRGPSAD